VNSSLSRVTCRTGVVLAALAAVVGAGGSSPASASGTAATVNGHTISVDDFTDTMQEIAAAGYIQLSGDGALATGDQARLVLGEMISNEVLRQSLEAAGVDPGADAPEGTDAGAASQPALLTDGQRYRDLLGQTGAFDLSELQEEYEASGEANGQVCAVVMLPADGDAADEAVAALAEGGDFTDVAADLGVQVGGVGGSADAPCGAVDSISSDVLDPLREAIADVGVGEPTDVVEIQGSPIIAYAPPFDEVSTTLAGDLVQAAVDDLLRSADVSVDPRYGRWDSASGRVVPLSTPVATDAPVDSAPASTSGS